MTFLFSFVFLAINIPVNVSFAFKEDSAAAIYWAHQDTDGSVTGGLSTIINSVTRNLAGYEEVTDVSASGELVTEYKGGVVSVLSEFGDSLYEEPAGSAIIWAQDQFRMAFNGQQFTAFAFNPNDTDIYQVSGYTALENTIGLWNWSRSIVYGFFIIILIAVAFMILFRSSLGGQQFVTLTNSLPSIVLSLVLITFSYPISALFIDAVSIGTGVAYNIIIANPNAPGYGIINNNLSTDRYVEQPVDVTVLDSNGTPVPGKADGVSVSGETPIQNVLQPDDLQMSIWSVFKTSNAKVCGKLPIIGTPVSPGQTDQCQFAQYVAPAAVRNTFTAISNKLVSIIGTLGIENVLIDLALIVLILTTQLKLLKRLLTDYLILSFFPILSPWLFLVAALPNRTTKIITDYVKILGFSALNMVIIYACFLILLVMGYSSKDTSVETTGFQLGESFKATSQLKWVPPMLGYSYGQIVGGDSLTDNANIITTVIIIAFFMAIPRIPEEIQTMMQVPQLPALMRNTGQDIVGGVKQAGGYAAGGVGGLMSLRLRGGKQ